MINTGTIHLNRFIAFKHIFNKFYNMASECTELGTEMIKDAKIILQYFNFTFQKFTFIILNVKYEYIDISRYYLPDNEY